MPDKRKHRGRHPEDERLFADTVLDLLREAVADFCWLRTRGYALVSALKLVGDRFDLTQRQRMAVRRAGCSDQSLARRNDSMVDLRAVGSTAVGIDGYNLLITIESALSGGLILIGRDGCYRDLASVHGTYRRVEETAPAIEIIVDYLHDHEIARVNWYLDKPVSNSGRLKGLMADILESKRIANWNIELVDSPDRVLTDYSSAIVTCDSNVLDRCGTWVNLARVMIDECVTRAWKVDLRSESDGLARSL